VDISYHATVAIVAGQLSSYFSCMNNPIAYPVRNDSRKALQYFGICCAFCAVAVILHTGRASARARSNRVTAPQQSQNPNSSEKNPGATQTSAPQYRDGQHDFDFELGNWKIHLSRLAQRLAGSTTWVDFDGTSVARKVWSGRANLEEFETDSPSLHIEGLALRVYNPQTHQWSIYWANSKDPALGQPLTPMVGEFKNGRGEFYDQELWNGRSVFVRFTWSEITPNSAHFEQSFSEDGGKTWEVNWITNQTRVHDESDKSH
jgi:hypothetical protein